MDIEDRSNRDVVTRIRRAAGEALAAIALWRASSSWDSAGRQDLIAVTAEVAGLLARLGPEAGASAIRAVVAPLLGHFWPRDPGPAVAAADAVDQLWLACIHDGYPSAHHAQPTGRRHSVA